MRKFYFELDEDITYTIDKDRTYSIWEIDGSCNRDHPYDTVLCWVTDAEDAKDLVNLLHKLQGDKVA
jgi:hypothetical protein